MNARIVLGLSLTMNLALFGWLGLHLNRRAHPAPNPLVTVVSRTGSPGRPEPAPAASAPAPPEEFRWSQIESEDYPTYIANLRAIGVPEKTIRDIVLADGEKSYQSRLETTRQTNSGQFWRTAEQREKLRRETNRRERESSREKRALIKTLLGLDYDQAALEAWWEEQEYAVALNFLPGSKAVEVIATVNRFEEEDNEIDDRSGGLLTPEDVVSRKSSFNQMLAQLGQRLTPSELEESELRFTATLSFAFAGAEPAELKLTGVELRELIRLKLQWNSPLDEEFEWPDQAFEETRRRGQEAFAARARKLLGDDRFAGLLRQDDSEFRPIHELAHNQHLSNSVALQAYEIMKATTDEIARVRRDRTLLASQRRAQMRDIRQSAEQALRQTLGERAFTDYLEQDATRWMVSPVNR